MRPPCRGVDRTDCRLGRGAGGNGDSSALGQTPVIGIFQRGGSIYTGYVLDGAGKSQVHGRRGRIEPDDILRAESWRGYGDPAEPGDAGTGRVKGETSKGEKNANGIRSFRAYARRRLAKFRGVPGTTFYPAPQGERVSVQLPQPEYLPRGPEAAAGKAAQLKDRA